MMKDVMKSKVSNLMKNTFIGFIFGIVVASAFFYFQTRARLHAEENAAKIMWGGAIKAIDGLSENMVEWANSHHQLPDAINLLSTNSRCSGAMYFRLLDEDRQAAFVVYPSLRTPGTTIGPVFAFVEIVQSEKQGRFVSNGTRAARLPEFQQMLVGKRWMVEVAQ